MGKKIIYQKISRGNSTIYRPVSKPTLFQLLQKARERIQKQQENQNK